MPQARKNQISLIDTPYYHCISRCVRRSFLCGTDLYSGQSYEHRRDWVEKRLLFLSGQFAIDVCAYAVMSNHTHVVLHVDRDAALAWSIDEVLNRYHRLHSGTLLTQRFAKGEVLSPSENISLLETVKVYRGRLYDISWFMRDLNEYIAREANKEDGCTGRFWEGRFKSQALLDEGAILTCMAYVDLNPIRAKMSKSIETASHTSIQKRIHALKQGRAQPAALMAFTGNHRKNLPKGIVYHLEDYCELLKITCRCIRESNAAHLDSYQSPILERLGLPSDHWMTLTTEFESHFCYAVGAESMMQKFKTHTSHQRLRGMSAARALFNCA
ncbi:transposase [Aliiglaciecola sp. LCG003]|uniref:transposase n=1 Tax=Aliiglaciecola sp. LCG003 TaxID=3053655 RepID=UPI00257300F0|nr:transposase [Aliiglaciecola sp. LCG003]WJG10663.1 transposase [Aliiglaciecola sp. LCG003]